MLVLLVFYPFLRLAANEGRCFYGNTAEAKVMNTKNDPGALFFLEAEWEFRTNFKETIAHCVSPLAEGVHNE